MAEEGSRVVLSTRSKIWLLLNISGMFVYLNFASQVWPPPGNNPYQPDAGDQIVWVLTVLPFLVFFTFGNIFWLVIILLGFKMRIDRRSILLWFLISALWISLSCYDHHRLSTSSWSM